MQHKYFFGYGSLVNRATHDYGRSRPARLTGWRRIWRHTDLRPVAYLAAIPDPTCAIDGLIAGASELGCSAAQIMARAALLFWERSVIRASPSLDNARFAISTADEVAISNHPAPSLGYLGMTN